MADLTATELRELAVRACVDPRTVKAYLLDKPMHSTTRAVVERALTEYGRADLVR